MAEEVQVRRSVFIPAEQVRELAEDEPEVAFEIGGAEDKAGRATASERVHISEVHDWTEQDTAAMRKATAPATGFISGLCCVACSWNMYAQREDSLTEWYYLHPSDSDCLNAGKRFKVKTVELEEIR